MVAKTGSNTVAAIKRHKVNIPDADSALYNPKLYNNRQLLIPRHENGNYSRQVTHVQRLAICRL
jgi:hypothetical protein